MNADWYVDPLGRYEGRYFDGENWTSQVKERGRLVVDPDWDRTPESDDDTATDAAPGVDSSSSSSTGGVQVPAAPVIETPEFTAPAAAAVEPVVPAATVDAVKDTDEPDYLTESPARQVAVLEAPVESEHDLGHTAHGFDAADGAVGTAEAASSGSRRWLYLVGAAILLAGLLLVLLPRLFGSDDVADGDDGSVQVVDGDEPDGIGLPETDVEGDGGAETDTAQAAEDDTDSNDVATGDDDAASEAAADADGEPATGDDTGGDADDSEPAADGSGAPDTDDDASSVGSSTGDGINVGSLEILNGVPVLRDLEVWHASSLAGRDVELGSNAGCWFGSIGEAVVQNAHCGPVAATPGAEPRFDLIPLRFEDIEDGVIQVRPITDAVVVDAVLPNGLDLVGADGPIDIASLAVSADEAVSSDAGDDDESTDNSDDTGRGARGERESDDG